jgi:hypothetical protein
MMQLFFGTLFNLNDMNNLLNKDLVVKDLLSTQKIKTVCQPFLEAPTISPSFSPPSNQ